MAQLIPYKSGFEVQPSRISSIGEVFFTNGSIEVSPNQKQCEAYGYTYDIATGTCRAFKNSQSLNKTFTNLDNVIRGQGNNVIPGTRNTYVMGVNNVVNGDTQNNIIAGNRNEITSGVNNTFVYGTLGNATADNSIVLGGNDQKSILGERQVTTLIYGHTTTDNSTTNAFLNNVTNSLYAIPLNAAMYFQADILAVDATESGSATGSFKAWVERGVVINKSGTASISRTRTSPASSGTTTGWSPVSTVSGTNYVLTVKGGTGQTVEWVASIRFTQFQSSTAL